MKSMILALLVATLSFNGYAQTKTEKETGNKENRTEQPPPKFAIRKR